MIVTAFGESVAIASSEPRILIPAIKAVARATEPGRTLVFDAAPIRKPDKAAKLRPALLVNRALLIFVRLLLRITLFALVLLILFFSSAAVLRWRKLLERVICFLSTKRTPLGFGFCYCTSV